MRVLLLKPPLTLRNDFYGIARFFPPIGLGYIASSLKKAGHEVVILDAGIERWKRINKRDDGVKYLGMSYEDISKRIKEEAPDLVGINILTVEATNASLVASAVKRANKAIKIVAGGPHVCVRAEETISDPNIDFIVIGEGEITTTELVNALEKKMPLEDVKGIWFKKNGAIFRNEARPTVKDLDELPFPAWDIMNLEKYFGALDYLQGSRSFKNREIGMITSRGCPFACIFCSIRLSMGRAFRPRSPENVISEIEYLVGKYDIKHIGFEDDNLTFDKKRMNLICDMLIEKGLNKKITWSTPNGVRADSLDEALLRKMREAGCTVIVVAPESGSQYVVSNIIEKSLDLRDVERVVRICKKIGIECACFFVVGIPGETIEQIEETVDFANKMRSLGAVPSCSVAWPYYGTILHHRAREKGYLMKKDGKELELGLLNAEAMIKTPEFTPEQVYKYHNMVQGDFDKNLLFELMLKRPVDTIRGFCLHPSLISKYFLKKYLLRIKK